MIKDSGSPPLEAEACLCRRYLSSQKGGTLIAEGVDSLAEHLRRLQQGTYRPDDCPRCSQPVHIHDRRSRLLAGDVAFSTEIARFRCSDRERCGAVWQVIPRLLARHLWRTWRTVEAAVVKPTVESQPVKQVTVEASVVQEVPARTRRRWMARLASSAALLVRVLSAAFVDGPVARVARSAGSTRGELVSAFTREVQPCLGQRLSMLAELIHCNAPGIRLM